LDHGFLEGGSNSLCQHSDTQGASEIAAAIVAALAVRGVAIAPLSEPNG
jgi:lactam utilization protein B